MLRAIFFKASSNVKLGNLLFIFALLTGCSSAAAQSTPSAKVNDSIRRLNEATGVRANSAELFEEFVTRYQANWPDAVIADYRAKGMFRQLTPEQTAGMEKLIHEFSDRVFGEMKKRVVQQLLTEENIEQLIAPVLNKYLTADEIEQLTAFAETPTGRKLFAVYSKKMKEAMVAAMEAKGAFVVLPDPAAEEAKADKLLKEGGVGLLEEIERNLKGRAASETNEFTADELQELRTFSKTPLGAKLTGSYLNIAAEIVQRNAKLYAPNASRIAGEVFAEQMEFFKRRTYEILKGTAGQKQAQRPSSN